MIYNGKEIEFPAIMQVSLFKHIEALEAQVQGDDEIAAEYAKKLLAEVDRYPELKDGISDFSQLGKYTQSIAKICKPLFPEVLTTNEIKILTPPFYFEPILTSQRFDNIIEASGEAFNFIMKDVDEDTFYLYCCYFILTSYYGYPIGASTPQLYEIANKNQGLDRVYKMLINVDMSDFIPTDKAVDITEEDYEELMDNFGDVEVWKKKFPPNSWIMRGINIVNFVDVTPDQSINAITSSLLVYDPTSFERIKQNVRKMLNDNSLFVGVINYENGKLETMKDAAINSLLLSPGEAMSSDMDMCQYVSQMLIENKEPLVVSNNEKEGALGSSNFAQKLSDSDFLSYLIVPVVHEGELLSFFEIGSKEKYKLSKGTLYALDQVMPIFGMAKKRFQTESQNLVEAIIQQECTTIHPSVKWRFEQEARDFMQKQMNGEEPVFKDIVFDQLYPLYGQLDIKGSSERRNNAVSKDLVKQLTLGLDVIQAANEDGQLPIYEELMYRLNGFIEELKNDLAAGSEHKILTFLKSDVYPVFDYLKIHKRSLRLLVENYYESLDPDIKTVYEERKKYDTSVNRINQYLASYLDRKQEEAQLMFPHYFERYKTDGVEFNMYIGHSITKDKVFDKVFLRNLRLWQLLVMCEMENEFQAIKAELNSPIEIASLILVYNTPIAVHFRMDEKKFDVEGAYNARYEIIKKRVDKAHIKGTEERITKPGSIVIVYSQESDANEYRTFLEFLAAKGYLKEEIQDLALEDLQGVHGLRALRVEINFSAGNLTIDEFIQEMEEVD